MKKLMLIFLATSLFFACEKEGANELLPKAENHSHSPATPRSTALIDVCHYDAQTNSWHIISINENAWPAHAGHGDVQLIDNDGDGWVTSPNECGVPVDCDDTNASVNPGATEIICNGIDDDCDQSTPDTTVEICDNGIDDDCDGNIDEADSDCSTSCVAGEVEIDFNGPLYVAPADEPGFYTWQQAIDKCNAKDTNGCDWELPSIYELRALYEARNTIGGFDQSGTNPESFYWSSTKLFSTEALIVNFSGGGFRAQRQVDSFRCRCVRR